MCVCVHSAHECVTVCVSVGWWVGRMFEYSVYTNVSLIFECILKLRIFVMHIIYLLFYIN